MIKDKNGGELCWRHCNKELCFDLKSLLVFQKRKTLIFPGAFLISIFKEMRIVYYFIENIIFFIVKIEK